VVAGRNLLLSRLGVQQGYSFGRFPFALAIQTLVLRVPAECDLERILWNAYDGAAAGLISEVSKAYQIREDDESIISPSWCPHKPAYGSRPWTVCGCDFFSTAADINSIGLPLPGIVPAVSTVGSDDFVNQHFIATSTKGTWSWELSQKWTLRRFRCHYIVFAYPSIRSHWLLGARRRSKRSQRQRCRISRNVFGSTAYYPAYPLSRWRSCATRPCCCDST
jgi:hypothetical protein